VANLITCTTRKYQELNLVRLYIRLQQRGVFEWIDADIGVLSFGVLDSALMEVSVVRQRKQMMQWTI
jgi:hypothetical protein